MARTFDPAILDRLRAAQEVEVETSASPGAARHRTIIWILVDDEQRVLVRSVRGAVGRWYREAIANPEAALLVDRLVIPVRVELAGDDERVEATSQALRAKYPRARASLAAMLREETLPTTLELLPR